jgi:hypothetical protein
VRKATQYFKVLKWLVTGRPAPPPHLVKQRIILANARRHHTRVMVETGTLWGDMVEAMKPHFAKIYSIEISPELAGKAKKRFENTRHVKILEGDSATVLKTLAPDIAEPALFWLDGHYSGGNTGKGSKDTPILEELSAIFSSAHRHIVLIDDARCFGRDKDYPTIDELSAFIRESWPGATIKVVNDSIVVTP